MTQRETGFCIHPHPVVVGTAVTDCVCHPLSGGSEFPSLPSTRDIKNASYPAHALKFPSSHSRRLIVGPPLFAPGAPRGFATLVMAYRRQSSTSGSQRLEFA